MDGIDLAAAEVCAGLGTDDLELLEALAPERCFGRGEAIARPGDSSRAAWIVLGGVVTVSAPGGPRGGPGRRVRSVGPGSMLGEMSLLSGERRSAWVHAETPVRVREIDPAALAELTASRPAAAAQLYANMARVLGGWLRDADPVPSSQRS